jgi:hypothetical protein
MYRDEGFSQGTCRMTQGAWYIGREGKQLGPYRYDSVRLAATNGKLRADDLLWTEGMPEWARADAIADLAPFLKKAAASATAAPSAAPAVDSSSAEVKGEKKPVARANFFVRHWRGDYSLPRSYWVNSVLVSMFFYLLTIGITSSGLSKNLDFRISGLWSLGLIGFSILIGIWSAVGVWRSADHHVERGGESRWASTAKVLMALGLIRLAFSAVELAPVANQSLSLAFGHDTMPASQLRVLNRATEVEIAGGLSFGTTSSLKTILDATPSIRLVQLNNVGGWIDEGARLSHLIEDRKLATYTARECDSSCLLGFLAGNDRYLGSHAKLGFHQASVAGIGGEMAKEGDQVFRYALEAKGVPQEFIAKALATPAASMWYPSTQELLDAHVITGVVDESKFGETGVVGWRDRLKLENEFAGVPLFAAVAQAEPKTYEHLRDRYVSDTQNGLPQSEIIAQVRTVIVGGMLPKYLAHGSALPLLAYWKSQVTEMHELRASDPMSCVAFMFPEDQAAPRTPAPVSQATRDADVAALTALLKEPLDTDPTPSQDSIQPALVKVAQRTEKVNPGAIQLFAKGDRTTSHPRELCDAAITFYSAIFALPPAEGAPLLKYLAVRK